MIFLKTFQSSLQGHHQVRYLIVSLHVNILFFHWLFFTFCLDRPGLRSPELVHKMQTKLKQVFNNILLPQHPEQATIFSELMTMVHDLRTLNTLHMEKFLQQHLKVQPSDAVDQNMAADTKQANGQVN